MYCVKHGPGSKLLLLSTQSSVFHISLAHLMWLNNLQTCLSFAQVSLLYLWFTFGSSPWRLSQCSCFMRWQWSERFTSIVMAESMPENCTNLFPSGTLCGAVQVQGSWYSTEVELWRYNLEVLVTRNPTPFFIHYLVLVYSVWCTVQSVKKWSNGHERLHMVPLQLAKNI